MFELRPGRFIVLLILLVGCAEPIEIDFLGRALGNRRAANVYSLPRVPHHGWPWPGQTPGEILKQFQQ